MSYPISFVERYKIVDAFGGPVTTNQALTSDYVSLKGVHKAWIVANFHQAASHATTIQPQYSSDVAGTGATNITHSAKWWKNADVSTTDTLTKQTAATSQACSTGTTHQVLVVEIDPDDWAAAGYDCACFTIATSSQATDFVSANFVLAMRYPQANPPSAIID
jgi:hypothetical protein